MKVIYIVLILFAAQIIHSQTPSLEWVKGLESEYEKRITDADLDQENNIYLKGFFKTELDFDPGPNSFILESQGIGDGYVLKLDPEGNFDWVEQLVTEFEGSKSALSIHDSIVYVTGANYPLQVLGSEYFLDQNDTTIHYVNAGDNLTVDHDGNILVLGSFKNVLDFDPSDGTLLLEALGSGDTFLAKLSSEGELTWVRQIGGEGYASGISIHADLENNIVISGQFNKSLDLDINQAGYELTTDGNWNSYVIKYSADGDILWYTLIGGPSMNQVVDMMNDDQNNILLGGIFDNTVWFYDSINPRSFQSEGDDDVFLAQMNPDGDFDWINVIGGSESQYVEDIAMDMHSNVYVTGSFYGNVDFDPGEEENYLTSEGFTDIFVQKYFPTGEYATTYHIPGPDFEFGSKLLFDDDQNMFLLGQYGKSVDFNLSSEINIYSALGFGDTFIAKYSLCDDASSTLDITGCESISINGEIYSTSGQYIQHLTSSTQCDSVINLNITIEYSPVTIVTVQICEGEAYEGYTISGTYQDIFPTNGVCDSIRTLILEVLPQTDPLCEETSIDQNDDKNLIVYPNPTRGELYFENHDSKHSSVIIQSIHGHILKKEVLPSS